MSYPASVWEAEIRAAAGKLVVQGDLFEALEADGFIELAMTAGHTRDAARLPALHRDPFDRMIVAQARGGPHRDHADPTVADYGATVLW